MLLDVHVGSSELILCVVEVLVAGVKFAKCLTGWAVHELCLTLFDFGVLFLNLEEELPANAAFSSDSLHGGFHLLTSLDHLLFQVLDLIVFLGDLLTEAIVLLF